MKPVRVFDVHKVMKKFAHNKQVCENIVSKRLTLSSLQNSSGATECEDMFMRNI